MSVARDQIDASGGNCTHMHTLRQTYRQTDILQIRHSDWHIHLKVLKVNVWYYKTFSTIQLIRWRYFAAKPAESGVIPGTHGGRKPMICPHATHTHSCQDMCVPTPINTNKQINVTLRQTNQYISRCQETQHVLFSTLFNPIHLARFQMKGPCTEPSPVLCFSPLTGEGGCL